MRGGHRLLGLDGVKINGSSPHARGTRHEHNDLQAFARFIPACAGDTWAIPKPTSCAAVHPRMRGGHKRDALFDASSTGSSPHARGTRGSPSGIPARGRFIPACAGDTYRLDPQSRPPPVHPRMRGGHSVAAIQVARHVGSSPHARGTPIDREDGNPLARFIPACAGDTWSKLCTSPRTPVHPRMRGGHFTEIDGHEIEAGSSPHARGTRAR